MTKILNIDELINEAPMIVVIDGVEHKMKTATLEDFLQNMKDLEAMAAAPSIVAETEITVKMIARSLPTLTEEDILKWPMPAITRLFDIVREADPDTQVEENDSEGNVSSGS